MKSGSRFLRTGTLLLVLLAAVSLLLPIVASGMDGGKVNINVATSEELTSLPGIGQAKADAIIAFREGHGPFATVDGLLEIRGIGAGLVEKLRDLVTTE
ncbi:MAG: ComEA family DNA-binding protein [bacterium]|nr:ComEA family DNA-binding protein [bacterium]MDT8395520.1 ComEA family DNA-binding protein [bacterium]